MMPIPEGSRLRETQMVAVDRRVLRTRFDSAGDLYQSARPDYPEQLYDTLLDVAGLRPGARVLEVGCATGKATLPLARRGMQLTCVEIGANLAAAARRNLAEYPKVRVVTGAFESARLGPGDFDLVFAATAWHWIDPDTRYERAWELLNDDGHLAFWSATHVFPDGGDPFFAELQEIYEEIGEDRGADEAKPRPGELPDSRAEIEQSGLFDVSAIVQFDWELSYTAEEYLRLLDTFSNHIAMDDRKRDRLYGEIRRRLDLRADGRLRRHWGAVLHIASRRNRV